MSNKDFNTNTENEQTWLTPQYIVEALGKFDLDPCCPPDMPWSTASVMNSLPTDGLSLDWSNKRVWLNPPYGRETFKWLDKLSETRSGIALIFARTETRGFHEQIWSKADSVFFFKGRLSFHKGCGEKGGTSNAPSCLVTYSREDTAMIRVAEENGLLKGRLVLLNNGV